MSAQGDRTAAVAASLTTTSFEVAVLPAVSRAELDEPTSEGQLRVRALDPAVVWLTHEREPWRRG